MAKPPKPLTRKEIREEVTRVLEIVKRERTPEGIDWFQDKSMNHRVSVLCGVIYSLMEYAQEQGWNGAYIIQRLARRHWSISDDGGQERADIERLFGDLRHLLDVEIDPFIAKEQPENA